ncbi:HD domain-containing protein [Streptomyces paromomycinus]|uniref:Phosphohydrolase n=1 Tax=Streptomyces paromomycinus TaxID=92743 RepID=A0A401W4T1_STREY|nr:HD domain-containing protein [Streptomyces paromomycinus]GCD44275.1 phosphohydrolase [Streptomyces paromomycinus]
MAPDRENPNHHPPPKPYTPPSPPPPSPPPPPDPTATRRSTHTAHTTHTHIAGIPLPDSALAREATDLIRNTTDALIYHHSRRVYLFGARHGRERNLPFDAELLYIAALFHGLGLTDRFHGSRQRFELDGADEARSFLAARGAPTARTHLTWQAIALHTTPQVPHRMAPEIALLAVGYELDVLGIGYATLPPDTRDEILTAHPRPGFKRHILRAYHRALARRPETALGTPLADVLTRLDPDHIRPDFVRILEDSAWPE